MYPKLSIIIPCYGVEAYLNRCMESLTAQSQRDIEFILVDDKSSDRVPELCDQWALRDNRIKVVHKPQNEGLGFARNTGLEYATGEYVAFVDSDDYVDEAMYEALYQEAKLNDSDAVFCGFKVETSTGVWRDSHEVDSKKAWTGEEINTFMLDMIASAPHVKKERLYQMSVWHAIYRRSIIEDNHIRFESEREIVSEDIPFHVDFLMAANKVSYLPQQYYYYCLNGSSLTAQFKKEKFERFKKLREVLIERTGNKEESNLRINRLFIGYTRAHLLHLYNSPHKNKISTQIYVVKDSIWKEIGRTYPKEYLPLYHRIGYSLILHKQIYLLQIYNIMINIIKKEFGIKMGVSKFLK